MKLETPKQRSDRILGKLRARYPKSKSYDLDGGGNHFVCETEPVSEHPEYDRAVEVIIQSKPHKHLKMTQYYTVISGDLELHVGEEVLNLKTKDKYTVLPGNVHWAKSNNECWVEIYSEPGWTSEDHIVVSKSKKYPIGFAPIDFQLVGKALFVLGFLSVFLEGADYLFNLINFPNNLFVLGLVSIIVSIYIILVVPKQ